MDWSSWVKKTNRHARAHVLSYFVVARSNANTAQRVLRMTHLETDVPVSRQELRSASKFLSIF